MKPIDRIGGLSAPSKMPCHCWSIPPKYCITGSKLRKVKGSTCRKCYGWKGMYGMANVLAAMERRWDVLQNAVGGGEVQKGWLQFVKAFQLTLQGKLERTLKRIERGQKVAKDGRYFRWFDNGDLQSELHLAMIVLIASRVPGVKFWLPTREKGFVKAFLKGGGRIPSNLNIRISLPMVDELIPSTMRIWAESVPGLTLSTVFKEERYAEGRCVAPEQDGHCDDCRACWNWDIPVVSYAQH